MPSTPDPLFTAFGTAIREQRVARGLSQDSLARAALVQRTYVVDLEQGRRNLTLRTLARFAAALDVSLGDLLADVDRRLGED